MSIIESANGVGARLAEARSDQGLSVEDLSSRTYIRPAVIRGIENDDFAACGGNFYARGHIRTLAHTLGIDEGALIEQFDRSNGAPEAHLTPERTSVEPVSRRGARVPRPHSAGARSGGGPGWMAVATVVLIVICLVALVSLLIGGPSNKGGSPAAKSPESPKVSAPAPKAAAPAAPAATPAYSGVNLEVRLANGSSWVKVTDENGRVLSADVKQQGASAEFRGAQQLRYTFGNAAAVTVACNGKDLGSLGSSGQVVSRVVALGDPACGAASG